MTNTSLFYVLVILLNEGWASHNDMYIILLDIMTHITGTLDEPVYIKAIDRRHYPILKSLTRRIWAHRKWLEDLERQEQRYVALRQDQNQLMEEAARLKAILALPHYAVGLTTFGLNAALDRR
ncbi:hypothetical protein TWF718_009668 [Orbilia javanica]|uniref:Uncharacterized protein n=1 Tax=Orbilia javanica TaxID=47235 RepID=A0AAN8RFU5_9PEZI